MDILEKSLFPFSRVRDEQKDMLDSVISALNGGDTLLAHAPTGIGKTAASLAPALAYGLENNKTVFFLTPKHSQHRLAIETLKKIKEKHNKKVMVVDMIGKQWTCLFEGALDLNHSEFTYFCQSHRRNETCRFCNDVVNPNSKEISQKAKLVMSRVKQRSPLHAEEVFELCKNDELCAYEIGTLMARKADVVIGDYYHIFHPHVRQALLSKMDKSLEDLILIVDEAHNLPDRVRRLMSSNLSEYTINNAIKESQALREENLQTDLEGLIKILKSLGNKLKTDEMFVKKENLVKLIEEETNLDSSAFAEDLEIFGEKILELPNRYRSYCSSISQFLYDWIDKEKDDVAYARIFNSYMSNTGLRYQISSKCLDPAIYSEEVFSRVHSSILMSGTLLPLDMYQNVLGIHNPKKKQLRNPFPRENRLVLLTHGITTKYTHRGDHMWKKISRTLTDIISSVPGNVAIFFPSYSILNRIAEMISTDKEPLLENQEMNKAQRYALYEKLEEHSERGGAVLFAVQAGSFSEGMDFPGKILDCAIVVGLPLERPSLETDALIKYYDFKFNRGWDYGYIYPAMNRALQAAGRCIRSETDRGAIILMDDRFKWANYRKCFPDDMRFIVTEKPKMYLDKFFSVSR
jgi:DNA excision repair protein ERCC-2